MVSTSSLSNARCVKQVDGVGFSLAGKVGKRERARIEILVEDYIRNNYDIIKSHFAAQARQGGTSSAVRLCINRTNDTVTIVSVNGNPVEGAIEGGGNGSGSGGGSGGGGSSGAKCYRRQRKTIAAADSSFDSSTAVAVVASHSAVQMAASSSSAVATAATTPLNCRRRKELDCGATGESMEAAIEYLMARDRRGTGSGSISGATTADSMVKERLLRSGITSKPTASHAVVLLPAATAPARTRRKSSSIMSPISFPRTLRTAAEEAALEATTKASATSTQETEGERLVSEAYDCASHGAAFRQLFPSVCGEFFVYYDHGESHCRAILTAMGFVEKSEQEEKEAYRSIDRMCLMWCNGAISASKRKSSALGYHIVNRLRFRGLITNKCSLVRTLAEFEINHSRIVPKGLEASSFLPATIHLNGAGAIDVFHKIRHSGIYLIKPGYSDCGKGIVLYRSNGTLESLISALTNNYPHYSQKDLVLQKYIENPLLLNGKKFDLRVFMLLIPNQRKEIGVYAFAHPGYVRLACRNFDLNSDDLALHLTNQAIQHRDKTYKQVKEDTVWSPDTLNQYLNKHRAELKVPCNDWAKRRLYPRIRAVLSHLVSVVSSSLCEEPLSYELFGCDFIVDDKFNVWLLEVNSDPSLNKSTKVLRRVITQVVEEAVGLAVEVLQRAVRGMPIKSLATEQDFRKIYSHTNESVQRCVMAESRITYPQHFVR